MTGKIVVRKWNE